MKHSRFRLFCLIASLFSIQSVFAGGFQLYELGTPLNGTAAVGQAVVDDASSAYYNPAAMANLPATELMIGVQAILPYSNFSPNSATTIEGNNGGSAGVLAPGLAAYYVYNFSPKWKFGVSLNSPYGGAYDYDNHWVGRYVVQQVMFYTMDLNPAIAYQINDWLALGGGFTLEYANINQTTALPLTDVVDGQFNLKADDTSPGFNLGIMLTPTNTTRVGLTYRSQIVHDFTGNIDFLNISVTPAASTKMVMPATITLSAAQKLNQAFTLLGELGWANWSSMKNSVVHVDDFTAVTQQNWHDTYRVGLAGKYQALSNLKIDAGASFDSSPTSASRRLPVLPVDQQIRLGAGLEYDIIKSVVFGVSYEYINLGKASIDNNSANGVFAGNYSRNFANVFQASLNVSC